MVTMNIDDRLAREGSPWEGGVLTKQQKCCQGYPPGIALVR